jgi:hypothetical protein
MIKTQYNACMKIFRTDNGTEYVNKEFDKYLSSFGIIHQTTCPGTSEQNGLAERKNRHLLEVTRCLMMAMNVPNFLWSEAVMTAAYLINRMPSRVLGYKAPIECLTGEISYVVPPKVFGCVCFVKDYRPSVSKLDPRALKCVFVGYSGKQKGYKCWCPSERRMFVSMDVVFREYQPFYGEPVDLSDVFPDLYVNDIPGMDSKTGGDKEGNSETTSRKVIVGVIPTGDEPDGRDEHTSNAEQDQDHTQGEQQEHPTGDEPGGRDDDTSNAERDHTQGEQEEYQTERSRWPQNLKVYSRRQRAEDDQVQGEEEISLSQNPDAQIQPDLHDSSSSPSTSDGIVSTPFDDLDIPIAQRKQPRSTTRKRPSHLSQYDISNYVSYSSMGPQYRAFIAALDSAVPIPHDWQEAKRCPTWRDAMLEEMAALDKNNTWVLTTLPPNKRVVGCKWVFTVKQNSEGKVERYKARLVAKGYSQTYGVDYDETFAPVAKMNTIRALISIAANNKWKLYQTDVKNAFLHGDLYEEVYMEIPPGFGSKETEGKVCKLKESLYGLKQSPSLV